MRGRLLVLAAVAAALAGACAPDGNQATATESATTVDEGESTEAGRESPMSSTAPTTGSLAVEPPSEECEAGAQIVHDDVALAIARRQSRDDIVDALQISVGDALDQLSAASTSLAGPAAEVGAVVDQEATGAGVGAVEAFDAALLEECDLRLSGVGTLRPDDETEDSFAGLGLAPLTGDTCDTASVLRWADAHWRAAPNGGERDRLGVVVRHALGALRLADIDDDEIELDLPADIERADLSGGALSPEHRIAIVRLDADLRRACDAGLALGGLLMERSAAPSAATLAAIPEPDWAKTRAVDADVSHSRWCSITDDIYDHDVAFVASEAFALEHAERLGLDQRLLLGALRVASRSGGSVATLADVRDVLAAAEILERADLSESGLLSPNERRAVADLDRVIVANCGVGLSSQFGLLGPYALRSDFDDPDARPGNVPTTTAAPEISTTTTSLPSRLPDTSVAVVGDSLTLSAQLEITTTLGGLGLGVVEVDGQVSRRMTSSTDTIRSGRAVVEEIAATSAPRIWVIALGTNDVASGTSRQSIRTSVERVLAAVPSDALVVWVDTWIRDERDAVVLGNGIIRDAVLARPGSVVADFFTYADDPGIVGGDGVHLTTAGRRLYANVMANGIADVLGRNPSFDVSSPTTVFAAPPPATDPAPPTAAIGTATSSSTTTTTSSSTSATSSVTTPTSTTTTTATTTTTTTTTVAG